MGFRKGAYCTVWSVDEAANSMKVRVSVSRKRKDTGEFEQDFSGFCSFIGTAKDKAKTLKVKDRIKLGDVDVTTFYNKDKGVEYVTYKVFDFDFVESGVGSSVSSKTEENPEEGEVDEDKLPF